MVHVGGMWFEHRRNPEDGGAVGYGIRLAAHWMGRKTREQGVHAAHEKTNRVRAYASYDRFIGRER